jgi:glyoxylase-like metal-dependent hydrolase (beta-lactamase superfamily II)
LRQRPAADQPDDGRCNPKRRQIVLGQIALTLRSELRIHTYSAPEEGWCVNSQIIETTTQLFVIDAQYMLPYAREAVAYAETLGKPITRLYVTHFHPDHILGAPAFSSPIYALGAVAAKIEAVGDRVAAEEHEKHGDAIPARAKRPDHIVTPGAEVVDGVRFEFLHLQHAETEHALMVGLPDHGILITQDLVYDRVHAFVGERAFDSWAAALGSAQALDYDAVLPGHGSPGGPELYDAMRRYLAAAQEALSKSSAGAELKSRLISAFPDHRGRVLLDHQMRFLFPTPARSAAAG